ncbi:MAG: MFS transporter [Thermoplasmataceae archaeon]
MGYRSQAVSINASRAVYALNWFNIAPDLRYIAKDLDLQLIQLGVVTTGFYVGLSLFQLVGGLLASKIGNRLTTLIGLMILGSSVIASGQSFNLLELLISRVAAGIGSALFFSPALGLLAEIVPPGKYAFYVGLFNGSFNLGAGLGIIGWNELDILMGWRTPLTLAGAALILLALENFFVLSGVRSNSGYRGSIFERAGVVLRQREIWLLPIFALAAILSETVVGQLLVYYLEASVKLTSTSASASDTIYMFVGFLGGLAGGRLFSKSGNVIRTFWALTVATSVLIGSIGLLRSEIAVDILAGTLGILTVNGFSMLYTMTTMAVKDRGMVSFSLAMVNFIQNLIGSLSPTIFSVVAFYNGYTLSWGVMGIMAIAATLSYFPMRSRLISIVAGASAPASA